MFTQLEHEALMRLMTHATGHTTDSRQIAHWLQEWDQAEHPRAVRTQVPFLSVAHALDMATVSQAALRNGLRPTTVGRAEYVYNMQNIARCHPFSPRQRER